MERMKFEKKNQLIDILKVGQYTKAGKNTYYLNYDVLSLISFNNHLTERLDCFKKEFQENEHELTASIYIDRCLLDLSQCIYNLRLFLANDINLSFNQYLYSNNIFDIDYANSEELEQNLKTFLKQESENNWGLVKYMINQQIQCAEEAISYIKEGAISYTHLTNTSQELQLKPIEVPESSKSKLEKRIIFNGKKIDLIKFFWLLHRLEFIDFHSRKDLERFLEENFSFKHGGNIKNVSGVENEISELLRHSKEGSFNKLEMKKINESACKLITNILKDSESVKLLSENGDDGWG